MPDKIPRQDIEPEFMYLVGWFWELRSYVTADDPLSPAMIRENLLHKYPSDDECATLLAMDRAYRSALSETIAKFQKDLSGKKK